MFPRLGVMSPEAGSTGGRQRPAGWQPQSVSGKALVVALHLLPGMLAYVLLRTLGPASPEVQIGGVMTGVMVLMAGATIAMARAVDGFGPRETLRHVGLGRFDGVGVLLAAAVWVAVLAVSSVLGYEDDVRRFVERAEWLALPSWHFQETDGFREIPPLLGAFALLANLVGEELWFRGYLQDKLAFLGRLDWITAGLLFTLYHVFEAPIAYPGVLGAVALAGVWALRRNLWPCLVLHTLLNAPV